MDEKERELYFLREKSIKDEISALANAEEKGIQIGIEQGIEKGIKLCQGYGSSRELAKHKIMEEFSLSAEQAEEKLNLYW